MSFVLLEWTVLGFLVFWSCDEVNQPTLTLTPTFSSPAQEGWDSHGLCPTTGQLTGTKKKNNTHKQSSTSHIVFSFFLTHMVKQPIYPSHTLPRRSELSVPTPVSPWVICHIDAEKQIRHSGSAAKWENCNIDCSRLTIKIPFHSPPQSHPDSAPFRPNSSHNTENNQFF